MYHYRLKQAATRVVAPYEPTAKQRGLAALARANQTDEERKLWKYIDDEKTGGCFVRQRPLFKHRVDFADVKLGLIIEVDGKHDRPKDRVRDAELSAEGYTIIRYRNWMIRRCVYRVALEIADYVIALRLWRYG